MILGRFRILRRSQLDESLANTKILSCTTGLDGTRVRFQGALLAGYAPSEVLSNAIATQTWQGSPNGGVGLLGAVCMQLKPLMTYDTASRWRAVPHMLCTTIEIVLIAYVVFHECTL
jgi:hypothetical protein